MPTAFTSMLVSASQRTKSGVMSGARSVLAMVMLTEYVTSPLAKKLMTLLETPPGQQPTRIMPMAKYGSSPKIFVSVNATSGMMVYCATAPRKMSAGRFIKLRTSSMVMVRPMLSMIMPRIIELVLP